MNATTRFANAQHDSNGRNAVHGTCTTSSLGLPPLSLDTAPFGRDPVAPIEFAEHSTAADLVRYRPTRAPLRIHSP